MNITILTGAGISAESGLKTFRDANGLWENHDVHAVASPEGWRKNQELVLRFYNERRRQLKEVLPNPAHEALARLESYFTTHIVTQNVDDLHERGGSTNVMHIHGELLKVRSTKEESLVYDWHHDLNTGDLCDKGHQLRPHIVWFGEEVPLLADAAQLAVKADVFLVVGTSMQVYPAASLIGYVSPDAPKFYIDPHPADISHVRNLTTIAEKASTAVPRLVEELISIYG